MARTGGATTTRGGTATGRPVRTVPPVLASFLLRVVPRALSEGVLVGEVEDVLTGDRASFRGAQELAAWCAAHAMPLPTAEVALPGPRPDVDLRDAGDPALPARGDRR